MRAGIALGSNIAPRLSHLRDAHARLRDIHDGTSPIPFLSSRIYETDPVDCPAGSPPFLNAVVEISTLQPPETLLHHLKTIEADLGRQPVALRNAPRVIDLDLLYCDNLAHSDSELILPHARLAERRFVLQPLCDIRPDLTLPQFGQSIAQLLESLPSGNNVIIIDATF